MASLIRPVQRVSCLPEDTPEVFPRGALKIAIVYLYDDEGNSYDRSWDKALMERVTNNRKKYCHKYGYTCINANEVLDKSKPAAWSKLLAVKKYITQYDYVMYLDMDAIIVNFDISLEKILSLKYSISNNPDFIMTNDWNGPNTGIWFARNSTFTSWFLTEAWNQKQLVTKKSSTGISHPFEYEQRAFHYLLYSDVWKNRKLPKYSGDIEQIRSHFSYLPQCTFNSYSLHPFYWKGDRNTAQYISGDFIIHFAGKKGSKKVNLMNYYLKVLEKSLVS